MRPGGKCKNGGSLPLADNEQVPTKGASQVVLKLGERLHFPIFNRCGDRKLYALYPRNLGRIICQALHNLIYHPERSTRLYILAVSDHARIGHTTAASSPTPSCRTSTWCATARAGRTWRRGGGMHISFHICDIVHIRRTD